MQKEAENLMDRKLKSIEFYYGHTGMDETSNYSEIVAYLNKSEGNGADGKSQAEEIHIPVCSKCPYTKGERGIVCSSLTIRNIDYKAYFKAELNSGVYLTRRSWWNEAEDLPCHPQINF